MKRFCHLAAMLMAIVAVACNKTTPTNPIDRAEIRLSSGVQTLSRAAFSSIDTQIPAGESIKVYVDEAGGGAVYENQLLTADGNGGLAGAVKMYFPESRRNIDIYAWHTNATLTAWPTSPLTHTVAADQRAEADYISSDLLACRSTNVERTSSSVGVTFHHLLSKIQVAVVPGKGLTALDIKGITLGGVRLQAAFTPDKAAAPTAIPVTAQGAAAAITIGADVSANFTTPNYNDAILVPQTVVAGTVFITVHLATGDLFYRLPADTVFDGGKRYVYRITAHLAEISLVSSIEDWTPINPVSGNAVLE